MTNETIEIEMYVTPEGRMPFIDWYEALKDWPTKAKADVQLDRLRLGNKGNWKFVGQGVFELKINFGPGFRIYFTHYANKMVLLLCGGDKRSQRKDILKAQAYWADYRQRFFS
jgi:putative addiction module killer protein